MKCGVGRWVVLVAAAHVAAVAVGGAQTGRDGAAAPRGDVPTYAKDIAPIVQQHCQACHRPGEAGPFPLLTYQDARRRATKIREAVADRVMPPWFADPHYGTFSNALGLSPSERDAILRWADGGTPEGDPRHLPKPVTWVEGWGIGQPDLVFELPEPFDVPARGTVEYQHVIVPTRFTEDRWIQAAEARPGNPSVVHHIIVYVSIGGKRVKDLGDGIGSGMLVAFAPGDFGSVYRPGTAKKIPKGATLVFQMHYTPNGTAQSDRSSVGLIFAKEPPKHEVKTRPIAQQFLLIWPHGEHQKFQASSTFKTDSLVWTLTPHMHLRGKSFEYQAVYPDGKRETILLVPRYDFGWQASYRLEQPLLLPAGSRIECVAHFDNSTKNRNNPDPSKLVRWGEQTWEEMMIGFVDYTPLAAAPRQ